MFRHHATRTYLSGRKVSDAFENDIPDWIKILAEAKDAAGDRTCGQSVVRQFQEQAFKPI